jgi:hypothetical protein
MSGGGIPGSMGFAATVQRVTGLWIPPEQRQEINRLFAAELRIAAEDARQSALSDAVEIVRDAREALLAELDETARSDDTRAALAKLTDFLAQGGA